MSRLLFTLYAAAALVTAACTPLDQASRAGDAIKAPQQASQNGDYELSNQIIDAALSDYRSDNEDAAKLLLLKARNFLALEQHIQAEATLRYVLRAYPLTEASFGSESLLRDMLGQPDLGIPDATLFMQTTSNGGEPLSEPTGIHPILTRLKSRIEQSTQDSEYLEDAYDSLGDILDYAKGGRDFINEAMEQQQTLTFEHLGDTVLVATTNQYRKAGFVLFFEAETAELQLKDTNFQLGIGNIEVKHYESAVPEYVVVVTHVTSYGTGAFNDAWRFYAVDAGSPYFALARPKSETNTGWGLYDYAEVEFKSELKVVVNDGALEIYTSGLVHFGEENKKTKRLPTEIYTWDSSSRSFDQIQGRVTHKQPYMSSVYGDIVGVKGDWFTKPLVIRRVEQ